MNKHAHIIVLALIVILSSSCTSVVKRCDCYLDNAEKIGSANVDYTLRMSFDEPAGKKNRKIDYIGSFTGLRRNTKGVGDIPQVDFEMINNDLTLYETDVVREYEMETWSLYKLKSAYYIIEWPGVMIKAFLSQDKSFSDFFLEYEDKVKLESRSTGKAICETNKLLEQHMKSIMYHSVQDREKVEELKWRTSE